MGKQFHYRLELSEGIQIGNVTSGETAGLVRWTGTQFEGHDGVEWGPLGGGGVSQFINLTDTPSTFSGQENKFIAVNAGATGLSFVDAPSGGGGGGATGGFFVDTRSYTGGVGVTLSHNFGTQDIMVEFWEGNQETDAEVLIIDEDSILVTPISSATIKTVVSAGFGDIGFETVVSFKTTDVADDLYSSNVEITGVNFSPTSGINDWQVATASGFSKPELPFNLYSLEEVQWKILGATQGVLLIKGKEI
jgi:hypothetical protein